MLSKLGLEADYAYNGKEVIELSKVNNYDLILMDIQMPLVNGLEASAKVNKILGKNAPFIAAITANCKDEVMHEYSKYGIGEIITKPINKLDLEKLVLNLEIDKEQELKNGNADSLLNEEILTDYLESGDNEDREFFYSLIVDYEKSYFGYKEKIDASIESQNIQELKNNLHSFKGISFNVGALKLAKYIENLERKIGEISYSDIYELEDIFIISVRDLKKRAGKK